MTDSQKTPDIVILGAGPAGMAAAAELSRHGHKVTVIEKDEVVGGLAKTLEFKEGDIVFRTDIGPHRFFSKNKKLYDFIEGVLGEQWMLVPRQTCQFIGGKFYDYPIRALQAFKNIGFIEAVRMMGSYAAGFYKYRILGVPIKNFEDYIVANFGIRLGRFNMLNYTEKIWGIPSNTIHADWAKQRIKGLSLFTAVKNALFGSKKKDGPKSLVDQFYYPEFGTGLIYESLRKEVETKGSELIFKSEPVKVVHANNRITELHVKTSKGNKVYKNPTIISSVPLTEFVKLFEPTLPDGVKNAVGKLTWRAQIYLFVTLDKERVTADNWIYFPESDIPVGRMSEMKNFSKAMSPEGKTSLFLEFFVTEGDAIWKKTDEEMKVLGIEWLIKNKFIKPEEIRKAYIMRKSHVYPVYDVHYKVHLSKVMEYLDRFENLMYIGRPGRFKYNNQDHSLEMGFAAAEGIISGTKPDFNHVGAEEEYFESGHITLAEKDKEEKVQKQFSKYIVSGGLATVADLIVLVILIHGFDANYLIAVALAYIGGMFVNFTISKRFAFRNQQPIVREQWKRFIVGALIGLAINELVIYLLVEYAYFGYFISKIISVGIVMVFSFVWHKMITFNKAFHA